MKSVKELFVNRFQVLANIYCLKYIGIFILEPRWICWLRFIAYFCSSMILRLGTSFRQLEIVHLTMKI